ncbi:52 kda repressor of the inhibitor of the protein kinase [Lasius niger]|uniref:52 kDa repressor of the inhibitor of the protein kinase n=1 Tax=Lasius niger TaxID=67767 RepID=A0A0J7KT25_LASNI|nr:52 kda repressor of the inhibitor of the protein kinase [Lasius niger]
MPIKIAPYVIYILKKNGSEKRQNTNKRPIEEIKTVQEVQEVATVQEGNKSDVQCLENPLIKVDAKSEPSTSSNTSSSTHPEKNNSSDKSPRKKKLRMQILKLKRQNKLRQMVRRLQLKQEKQKKTTKNQEINDIKNMRQLGAPIEKHCILCVDEMSLKAHLFYNVSQDDIIGFEDMVLQKQHVEASF